MNMVTTINKSLRRELIFNLILLLTFFWGYFNELEGYKAIGHITLFSFIWTFCGDFYE